MRISSAQKYRLDLTPTPRPLDAVNQYLGHRLAKLLRCGVVVVRRLQLVAFGLLSSLPLGQSLADTNGAAAISIISENFILKAEANLRSLAANELLVASLETLDTYGVVKALEGHCKAYDLSLCEAFDGDGDPLTDEFGAPRTAKQRLSKDDLAALHEAPILWRFDRDKLSFSGISALKDGSNVLGYLHVQRALTGAWLEQLSDLLHQPVALTLNNKVVLSSSLSAATEGQALSGQWKTLDLDDKWSSKLLRGLNLSTRIPLESPPRNPSSIHRNEARDVTILSASAILLLFSVAFVTLRYLALKNGVTKLITHFEEAGRRSAWAVPPKQKHAQLGRLAELADTLFCGFTKSVQALENKYAELSERLEKIGELLMVEDGAFAIFLEKSSRLAASYQRLDEDLLSPLPPFDVLTTILRQVYDIKIAAKAFGLMYANHAARHAESVAIKLVSTNAKGPEQQSAKGTAIKPAATSQVSSGDLAELRVAITSLLDTIADYEISRTKLLSRTKNANVDPKSAQLSWLKSILDRLFPRLRLQHSLYQTVNQHLTEYQEALSSIGKEDLSVYIARYNPIVREFAEKAGKFFENIRFVGDIRHFDLQQMRLIDELLLHCLRNAIDHGIESPSRRTSLKKPKAGQIIIETRKLDRMVSITVRDDGRGFSIDDISARAVARGLRSADDISRMTRDEIANLLFEPGFSTANVISEMSGRGLGLDVVRNAARALKGDVQIDGQPDLGCRVAFHFPVADTATSARISVFHLAAEITFIILDLRSAWPHLELIFEPPTNLKHEPVTATDRMVLGMAIKSMLALLVREAPNIKRLCLGLTQRGLASSAGLILKVSCFDTHGRVLSDCLPRVASDTHLTHFLLEGGLWMELATDHQSLEIVLNSAHEALAATPVKLAMYLDHGGHTLRQKIHTLVDTRFPWLRLHETLGLTSVNHKNAVLVVTDGGHLDEVLAEFRNHEHAVFLISTRRMTEVAWTSLHDIVVPPVIVEGEIDETSLALALEKISSIAMSTHAERQGLAPRQAA